MKLGFVFVSTHATAVIIRKIVAAFELTASFLRDLSGDFRTVSIWTSLRSDCAALMMQGCTNRS